MGMTVWTVFCWLYLYYSLCNGYTQEALKDEIASLPGAPTALKSKHFSGHLPITTTKFIHYFFIESERDPTNDPLVFWTNGGPGKSVMLSPNRIVPHDNAPHGVLSLLFLLFCCWGVRIGCSGLLGLFTGECIYLTLFL